VALRASLNKGLTDELKLAFPSIVPVQRPEGGNVMIPDSNWVSGFTSGEGSFVISIFKSNTFTGFIVRLRFNITQHSRDAQLMQSLVNYLGCGRYVTRSENSNHGDFIVSSLSEITNSIIPFLKKYPIKGNKSLDFSDFCEVAKIMENKDHIREEGLNQIRLIQAGMNRNRNKNNKYS